MVANVYSDVRVDDQSSCLVGMIRIGDTVRKGR